MQNDFCNTIGHNRTHAPQQDRHKKKDRLVAASAKSDDVLCSGGCDCSGVLLHPAIGKEAETDEDVARALAKTKAFKQSRRDSRCVEILFAHLRGFLLPQKTCKTKAGQAK